MSEAEQRLYDDFELELWSKHGEVEKFLAEITGWHGMSDLAELVVRTLVINIGGCADMPWRTKCACGDRPFDAEGNFEPWKGAWEG